MIRIRERSSAPGVVDDDARGGLRDLPHREHPGAAPVRAVPAPRLSGTLLVDTGIVSTPDEVILPAFQELGLDPGDLDYILITYADVDHFGGNAAIRSAAPRAIVAPMSRIAHWIGDGSGSCASAMAGTRRTVRTRTTTPHQDWLRTRGTEMCRSISISFGGEVLGSARASRSRCSTCRSLAGAHRTLGSGLQERDHHRRRARRLGCSTTKAK